MSRQVIWEAQAIDQAAGFLRDDPNGVREMLDAVARLADEPRPAGSFPYGSPDRRRLRIAAPHAALDGTPILAASHLQAAADLVTAVPPGMSPKAEPGAGSAGRGARAAAPLLIEVRPDSAMQEVPGRRRRLPALRHIRQRNGS